MKKIIISKKRVLLIERIRKCKTTNNILQFYWNPLLYACCDRRRMNQLFYSRHSVSYDDAEIEIATQFLCFYICNLKKYKSGSVSEKIYIHLVLQDLEKYYYLFKSNDVRERIERCINIFRTFIGKDLWKPY